MILARTWHRKPNHGPFKFASHHRQQIYVPRLFLSLSCHGPPDLSDPCGPAEPLRTLRTPRRTTAVPPDPFGPRGPLQIGPIAMLIRNLIRKLSKPSMYRSISGAASVRLLLQEIELLAIEQRLAQAPPDCAEAVPMWDETSESMPLTILNRKIQTTVHMFVFLSE